MIRAIVTRRTLGGRRLVDQHDGNSITHRVSELVAVTDQRVFGFPVLERPLALGAYENFEQLRCDRHVGVSRVWYSQSGEVPQRPFSNSATL